MAHRGVEKLKDKMAENFWAKLEKVLKLNEQLTPSKSTRSLVAVAQKSKTSLGWGFFVFFFALGKVASFQTERLSHSAKVVVGYPAT